MTSAMVWACERSVDVDVPASFAWQYMTDIGNWDDPPAEFVLDGPFAVGGRGTTRVPGQPDRAWTIQDLTPGRAYILRAALAEHAFVLFHWRFDPLTGGRTRLTQRVELCGTDAAPYVNDVQAAFEPNLQPGMERIARLMRSRVAP